MLDHHVERARKTGNMVTRLSRGRLPCEERSPCLVSKAWGTRRQRSAPFHEQRERNVRSPGAGRGRDRPFLLA